MHMHTNSLGYSSPPVSLNFLLWSFVSWSAWALRGSHFLCPATLINSFYSWIRQYSPCPFYQTRWTELCMILLAQEHIPRCLLDVLHSSDVSEAEVLSYGQQLASAMTYLHQKDILHCDLAARNISFLPFPLHVLCVLGKEKIKSKSLRNHMGIM